MRPRIALFAATTYVFAGSAGAQTLWGADVTGSVDQIAIGGCLSQPVCPLPSLVFSPHAFPLGGSDWDNCTDTLWASDGTNIINVDKNCNVLCASPGLPGFQITGLAVDCLGRRVFASDANGVIVVFQMGSGCLTFVSRCLFPIQPPQAPITGLAYDGFNNRLWACDSQARAFALTFVPNLTCTLVCQFQAVCNPPIGPVSGLAYDSCNRRLYMYAPILGSTLATLVTNQLSAAGTCPATTTCCQLPPAVPGWLSGLAFEPPSPGSSSTPGCSGANCPACTPVLTAVGLPVIGSSGCFSLQLTGAPCPSSAFLFVSLGPCFPNSFGLCGPVWVNLGSLILQTGAVIPPCTPNCGGQATVPISIPNSPLLCGFPLCAQWAVVCAGGGISLSNGLTIQLVGP